MPLPWRRRKLPTRDSETRTATASTTSTAQTPASSRKVFPSGIKLLYDHENSTVDIVFIHGLTGHREKTWTAKNAAAPWPKTLLPPKIPDARVLTFGYDAGVADWKGLVSESRIANHSTDLLVALANYREEDDTALVLSQQEPEMHLRNILQSTFGIIFLGTPHRGSGLATWAERLATFIGVVKQTNSRILEVLRRDSEVLSRIQDSFHMLIRSQSERRLPPIKVTCFYEQLPLPGIGFVVPQDSATLPGYTSIGIRNNHMDMTKFEGEDDPGFVAVISELRRWNRELSSADAVTPDPVTPDPSVGSQKQPAHQSSAKFIIPYASNPDFVGRSDIMESLQAKFSPYHRLEMIHHVRAALYGLGGIGKTQIAIKFAYWAHESFPEMSVFWIHASNSERFLQSILKIAEECQIPGYDDPKTDKGALVKNWLQEKCFASWLLIIDNADDHDMFFGPQSQESNGPHGNALDIDDRLGRYIPECSHGSILITTRNKQAAVRLTRNRGLIEVERMNEIEAGRLLTAKLKDEALDDTHIELLTSRLESLPLALAQAAAFMQENSTSIEEYLQLLDQGDDHVAELLNQPFEEVGRDSEIPNAVIATWILSFKQIRTRCPLAGDILSLMSCFDRQRIPKVFLQLRRGPGANNSEEGLQSGASTDIDLEKAIGVLKAFSFVIAGTERMTFNVHRLVQLAMRKWLVAERTAEDWAEKALLMLSDLYPFGRFNNRDICSEYLPHAYSVLSCKLLLSEETTIARASLLHCMSGFLNQAGQYKKEEVLLLEARDLRKKVLGDEHRDTLASTANLANSVANQGRWKESEELQVQVMETHKRALGLEHPDTLHSMADLAMTMFCLHRFKEAEELQAPVMETRRRVLGTEHPDTLRSICDLALNYSRQGRLMGAELLLEQAVETCKRVLGMEHPNTLRSICDLALNYSLQGRWKEAGVFGEQALETCKRVLGTEHAQTLRTMANLALNYSVMGRLREAEVLGEQAVEACKRVYGTEHPNTLTDMANLAVYRKKMGRYTEAIQLLEECVRLRKRILGSNHPYTLSSSSSLTRWKQELGTAPS